MRAEQSSKVSSLRYFHLVQPSPFYTPQYHKPASHQGRHTPTHRQSVLNTIATPSRGKRQKAVDMLITSLLSSDEESGNGDDVIDNKDDVIVIDDDEEAPVVSSIIEGQPRGIDFNKQSSSHVEIEHPPHSSNSLHEISTKLEQC